jgi:hypothetical protein
VPLPGSHKYEIKRRKLRKELEGKGAATDAEATRQANTELQRDRRNRTQSRNARRLTPKGER